MRSSSSNSTVVVTIQNTVGYADKLLLVLGVYGCTTERSTSTVLQYAVVANTTPTTVVL